MALIRIPLICWFIIIPKKGFDSKIKMREHINEAGQPPNLEAADGRHQEGIEDEEEQRIRNLIVELSMEFYRYSTFVYALGDICRRSLLASMLKIILS
jgi:hypothetical protein